MSKIKDNKELWRTIKFALFSASAGIIQFGSFTLMTLLMPDSPYMVRYLISLVLSVIWNFTLNRKYTFQSANNVPIAMLKVAAFYAVFTPVTTIGGGYLVDTLGWNDFLVEILTMALNFVTEYLYDKYVVFRGSIDTNDVAKREEERTVTDMKKLDSIIEYLQNHKTVEFNPYPNYAPEIQEALGMLETDEDYMANHEKLEGKPISEMNHSEIATMLTFISRGERFCDGHTASFVESGELLELMARLKEIG